MCGQNERPGPRPNVDSPHAPNLITTFFGTLRRRRRRLRRRRRRRRRRRTATATATTARKFFSKSRSRRRGRFRQIFVEIGAILAIFRPFEVFGSGRPDARTSGRPSVRTSERPDVRASERRGVRASHGASERAGIRARPRKYAEYSVHRVLENTVVSVFFIFLPASLRGGGSGWEPES